MSLAARIRPVLASVPVSRCVAAAFAHHVPSRAGRIDVKNPAISSSTAAELFFRLYERHELALIRQTMLTDYDVIEFGSGIGVTGSLAAQRLSPGRRLVCVEANPELLDTLRRNANRHRGATTVTIVHGALAYGGVPLALHQSGEHMKSRVTPSASGPRVPAVTLAELLRDQAIGDYLLIMDVEGAERAMLTHDAAALNSCQQIIVELHGTEAEIAEMVRELLALGFRQLARRKSIVSFARSSSR